MKTGRVRIVCKAPELPDTTQIGTAAQSGMITYPLVNGILADLSDTHVFVLNADGTETEIQGIEEVVWSVEKDGTAVAVIGLRPDSVDLEAIGDFKIGDEDDLIKGVIEYIDEAKIEAGKRGRLMGEPLADWIRRVMPEDNG